MPRFQKLRKQVRLLRSCTLCMQRSVQRKAPAVPEATSLCLPLKCTRETPASVAQVCSRDALPCPSSGPGDRLAPPPGEGGRCGNNTCSCSDKGVVLAKGRPALEGGVAPPPPPLFRGVAVTSAPTASVRPSIALQPLDNLQPGYCNRSPTASNRCCGHSPTASNRCCGRA